MARPGDGYVGAFNAWVYGLLRRSGRLEPRELEIPRRCAALSPPQADGNGEHSCTHDELHAGRHSWQLHPNAPRVCERCKRRLEVAYIYDDVTLCGACALERDTRWGRDDE